MAERKKAQQHRGGGSRERITVNRKDSHQAKRQKGGKSRTRYAYIHLLQCRRFPSPLTISSFLTVITCVSCVGISPNLYTSSPSCISLLFLKHRDRHVRHNTVSVSDTKKKKKVSAMREYVEKSTRIEKRRVPKRELTQPYSAGLAVLRPHLTRLLLNRRCSRDEWQGYSNQHLDQVLQRHPLHQECRSHPESRPYLTRARLGLVVSKCS